MARISFITRTWNNSKEYSHNILGFLVFIESITAIINLFKEYFPESIIDFIESQTSLFLDISLIVLLCTTLSLYFVAKAYLKLRKRFHLADADLRRYRSMGVTRRIVAEGNAKCDKQIFDKLFLQLNKPQIDNQFVVYAVNLTINEINVNIVQVLEGIRDIFTNLTGADCAVCIKVFVEDQKFSRIDDLVLDTLARNRKSESERSGRSRVTKVGDNSAFMAVVRLNSSVEWYYNNDLAADRGYKNSAPDWKNHYNSTFVVPIVNLNSSHVVPMKGVLCVDSKLGQFEEEISLRYLRELAWRISVMLYRLERLGQFIQP